MNSQIIKIKTKDNQVIKVPTNIAFICQSIKMILIDTDYDEYEGQFVDSKMYEIIFEYCRLHENLPIPEIEQPLRSPYLEDIVCPEDYKFISQFGYEEILEIAFYCDYLGLDGLQQLCAARVAALILGQNTEFIRNFFHLSSDLTQNELGIINEENKYAELD